MTETDEGNLLINMQSVVQSCNGHKSVRPNAKTSRRKNKKIKTNEERIKRKIYMDTIKHQHQKCHKFKQESNNSNPIDQIITIKNHVLIHCRY